MPCATLATAAAADESTIAEGGDLRARTTAAEPELRSAEAAPRWRAYVLNAADWMPPSPPSRRPLNGRTGWVSPRDCVEQHRTPRRGRKRRWSTAVPPSASTSTLPARLGEHSTEQAQLAEPTRRRRTRRAPPRLCEGRPLARILRARHVGEDTHRRAVGWRGAPPPGGGGSLSRPRRSPRDRLDASTTRPPLGAAIMHASSWSLRS